MKDKIKNNLNNIKEVTNIRADYELMDIDYIDKEDKEETITDADEFDVLYYIQHLQNEMERLKDLCNKYEEEHNTTFKEWKKVIQANIKASRQIEILLEIALEQDSENVNLIDRLKGILDILKGNDKE